MNAVTHFCGVRTEKVTQPKRIPESLSLFFLLTLLYLRVTHLPPDGAVNVLHERTTTFIAGASLHLVVHVIPLFTHSLLLMKVRNRIRNQESHCNAIVDCPVNRACVWRPALSASVARRNLFPRKNRKNTTNNKPKQDDDETRFFLFTLSTL